MILAVQRRGEDQGPGEVVLAAGDTLLLQGTWKAQDRQPAYAAQFALSHACLLLTYPLAGWLGATAGMPSTFAAFALIVGAAAAAAARLWPHHDRGSAGDGDPAAAAGSR